MPSPVPAPEGPAVLQKLFAKFDGDPTDMLDTLPTIRIHPGVARKEPEPAAGLGDALGACRGLDIIMTMLRVLHSYGFDITLGLGEDASRIDEIEKAVELDFGHNAS